VTVKDPIEYSSGYFPLNHNSWYQYWLVAVAVDKKNKWIDCAMYVRDSENPQARWREWIDQWIRLQFPAGKFDDDLNQLWHKIIHSTWIDLDHPGSFELAGENDNIRNYTEAEIANARKVDEGADLEAIEEGEIAKLQLKYKRHVVTGKIYKPIPGVGKIKKIKDFPGLFERITGNKIS
jgi:hypothetical protein